MAAMNYGGDDALKRELQSRVDRFDTDQWHRSNEQSPGYPLRQESLVSETRLHNPYAGVPYAWQLTERLDDFLTRLPPATTEQGENVPWIYICNPYIPRLGRRPESSSVQANEDEAPAEEGGQLELVVRGGEERLQLVSNLRDKMRRAEESEPAIEKEMRKERKQAVRDILTLAHAAKVRTGKWMLFCSQSEVNEIWELVAKATANNELGIAAKVAPRSPMHDQRRDRLLCVYTADFRNKADVGRVLRRLRELKLVETRSRRIYYKPDVFTYIGISHGNPWGLNASIYTSKDEFDSDAMDWEASQRE
ncbi:hypothetical protein CDD80_888 [Ophiocordyceps camponoti-rufipedis]|uniref:DUF1917 domain-containing protein n=1 Tax=Ophiocordyceps camponoti-rufipedis TaxID=2004952 RepID=A0A2C5YGF9_9HYPO|nr:hypothetical protein CDD80_888 [Ophiocordyceps camponoti-rufipedis]